MTNKNKLRGETKFDSPIMIYIESEKKVEITKLMQPLGLNMSGFLRSCLYRLEKDGNANFVQEK